MKLIVIDMQKALLVDELYNVDIKAMYEFLKEIGYVMSDMEIQLMDGTHECYTKD